MYSEQNKIIYWVTHVILRLVFGSITRFRVVGAENLPAEGGVLIAPNHLTYWDPPLVAVAIDSRMICFMGKESLFNKPVFSWYIRKIGTFPVRRGGADIKAFKTMLRLLKSDNAVLMFPEGTRGDGIKLGEPLPGIGGIAGSAGVPVVPVLVVNARKIRFFKRTDITVVFGRPMYFKSKYSRSKENYAKFGKDIINSIKSLDTYGFYKQ